MLSVDGGRWNALLAMQATPTPFMRHEYLAALELSGSATAETGWTPCPITLEHDGHYIAGCALYAKTHSWGEYVFDWSWAEAYERHGLKYYPKLVLAVPFTPVPGSRLLARDSAARTRLIDTLLAFAKHENRHAGVSSLHVLMGDTTDTTATQTAGLLQRTGVQFHWRNQHPQRQGPFSSFDDFLATLTQERRKKIRQERRKVADAGVRFRVASGESLTPADWAFFYECHRRTYLEHGHTPYLTPDFFERIRQAQAGQWVMFIAERDGRAIATSLIAISQELTLAAGQFDQKSRPTTAFGRYWGALERVDCLHFEACYYQPLEWCIQHGIMNFEGGAQGEHKMARALMPVTTHSAHWLAHPAFADAVNHFLRRETQGLAHYVDALSARSPFRQSESHPEEPPA